MVLSNIRVIEEFDESDALMKKSDRKTVRLQTGYFIHEDESFNEADFRSLAKNSAFFYELAAKLPDVDFLLVPGGTVTYWTFYNGRNWEHVNHYKAGGVGQRITFSEDDLRAEGARHGIEF